MGAYFAQGGDATQGDRVYYSFTVLTTTGFGDLTADTPVGHALAVSRCCRSALLGHGHRRLVGTSPAARAPEWSGGGVSRAVTT